jgi:hypothetical protein
MKKYMDTFYIMENVKKVDYILILLRIPNLLFFLQLRMTGG